MKPEKQGPTIRLNKFISNAGVCARRMADRLIQAGHITVNGQQVNTLGYQVAPQDVVQKVRSTMPLASVPTSNQQSPPNRIAISM